MENPTEQFIEGPQYIVTVIGQVIRSFLWDLPGRWKQFLKKKTTFTMKNNFGHFFLVLPSLADIR